MVRCEHVKIGPACRVYEVFRPHGLYNGAGTCRELAVPINDGKVGVLTVHRLSRDTNVRTYVPKSSARGIRKPRVCATRGQCENTRVVSSGPSANLTGNLADFFVELSRGERLHSAMSLQMYLQKKKREGWTNRGRRIAVRTCKHNRPRSSTTVRGVFVTPCTSSWSSSCSVSGVPSSSCGQMSCCPLRDPRFLRQVESIL